MPNFGILFPSELKKFFLFRVAACATAYHRPLPLFKHMDSIHCRTERGKERRGSEKKMESALNQQFLSSSSVVWLTPRGKTDISFLSTLSEDFADFFPRRSENLVCLRIRAPTFLDRVMFGRLTGKWIGEDALGATMQEFNRPEKPAIWICWENLFGFGSNLSPTLGTIVLISQNYQWGINLDNTCKAADASYDLLSSSS